jgi:multiple sugar transport system ATP-binding protein
VLLAERLGRNIELTVAIGGTQLIVLTSGRHGVGEGDQVSMSIADNDIHVFAAGDVGEGDTPRLEQTDSALEAAK